MVSKANKGSVSREIKESLNFFGAKNEDELNDIIEKTWNIARCIKCGKQIDLMKCSYIGGDPVCFGGCNNG